MLFHCVSSLTISCNIVHQCKFLSKAPGSRRSLRIVYCRKRGRPAHARVAYATMPKPEIEFTPVSCFESKSTETLTTTLLSTDDTGNSTMVLQHAPGSAWGQPACKHGYWEECYILEGRLFDETLGRWFEAGHYCCRPPGMMHGPYRADEKAGCKEICFIRYDSQF